MKFQSDSDKALRFLIVFGDVSDILEINGDTGKNPSHLFEVDEKVGSVDKIDHVFIKIVTSLQMNKEDHGLTTLKYMSSRATIGEPLEKIINSVTKKDLRQVLGLCTDVLSGIKYILRKEDKKTNTYSNHINVYKSFIQCLERNLGV